MKSVSTQTKSKISTPPLPQADSLDGVLENMFLTDPSGVLTKGVDRNGRNHYYIFFKSPFTKLRGFWGTLLITYYPVFLVAFLLDVFLGARFWGVLLVSIVSSVAFYFVPMFSFTHSMTQGRTRHAILAHFSVMAITTTMAVVAILTQAMFFLLPGDAEGAFGASEFLYRVSADFSARFLGGLAETLEYDPWLGIVFPFIWVYQFANFLIFMGFGLVCTFWYALTRGYPYSRDKVQMYYAVATLKEMGLLTPRLAQEQAGRVRAPSLDTMSIVIWALAPAIVWAIGLSPFALWYWMGKLASFLGFN